LNTRGVILFRQNKLVEAKLDLQKCLELPNTLAGTRARSLAFLGRIALRDGQPPQARTYLTQALSLDQKTSVLSAQERAEIERLVGEPATRAAAN
jgi:Tfp pilus assembly protein PilF